MGRLVHENTPLPQIGCAVQDGEDPTGESLTKKYLVIVHYQRGTTPYDEERNMRTAMSEAREDKPNWKMTWRLRRTDRQ